MIVRYWEGPEARVSCDFHAIELEKDDEGDVLLVCYPVDPGDVTEYPFEKVIEIRHEQRYEVWGRLTSEPSLR
jgi:hypothetical protein